MDANGFSATLWNRLETPLESFVLLGLSLEFTCGLACRSVSLPKQRRTEQ
jgi:hypothetical protein